MTNSTSPLVTSRDSTDATLTCGRGAAFCSAASLRAQPLSSKAAAGAAISNRKEWRMASPIRSCAFQSAAPKGQRREDHLEFGLLTNECITRVGPHVSGGGVGALSLERGRRCEEPPGLCGLRAGTLRNQGVRASIA